MIFGLFSAIFYGISNVYWKIANKTNHFLKIVFFRNLISVIVLSIIWLLQYYYLDQKLFQFGEISTIKLVTSILLCIFCSLGLICFLKSLQYAKVFLSILISSINIFSTLTAILFLHEKFKISYKISFCLSITGIICIQNNSLKNNTWNWNKGTSYAFLASFFWGTSYALFKIIVTWIGIIPLSFLLECSVLLTSYLIISINKLKFHKKDFSITNLRHYLILAVLLIGGTVFYNLSIFYASVLMVNIFQYISIVIALILSKVLFKEQLNGYHLMGCLLVISSLIISQF